MIDRAALWSVGQQFGRQGINYLAFAVLALFLSPQAFGLVGIGLVWINFGQIFAELGFGAAIVQRPTLHERHLSTTFALNLVIGALLTVAGILGAGPIAFLFDAPAAEPVIRLLSTTFVLRSLGLTHAVIAQRNLDFRGLATRDTIAAAGGAAVGIPLAIAGFEVYALVWQSIASSLLGSLLFLRMTAWRPNLTHCSRSALSELWSYSSQIFLFGAFKFLAQNADKLVVAYLLGPAALGIYTLASRLVLVPISTFAGALGSYLFPKLASLQSRRTDARAAFVDAMAFTARVIAPVVVVTAIIGPGVVRLVFGAEWTPASQLLPLMAVTAAATAVISPAGQVMKAMGRPQWLLWWAVAFTGLIVAALAVGAPGGLRGMTAAVAIAHVGAVAVIQRVLSSLLGLSVMQAVEVIRTPVLGSLGSGAIVLVVSRWLPMDAWSGLAGASIAFAAAYVAAVFVFDRVRAKFPRASPSAD